MGTPAARTFWLSERDYVATPATLLRNTTQTDDRIAFEFEYDGEGSFRGEGSYAVELSPTTDRVLWRGRWHRTPSRSSAVAESGPLEARRYRAKDGGIALVGTWHQVHAQHWLVELPEREPRPTPRRDSTALRRASVHVHYDLSMLLQLADRLSRREAWNLDEVTRCAFVESFIVHARTLCDFLWMEPNPNFEHDIRAHEYLVQTPWVAPPAPRWLAELADHAGKHIMHLSHLRPQPGSEKRWPQSKIASEILAGMSKFRADVIAIDPSLLSEKWRNPLPSLSVAPQDGKVYMSNATGAIEYSASTSGGGPPTVTEIEHRRIRAHAPKQDK